VRKSIPSVLPKERADKLRKLMARADERYGTVFRRLAK
jgi:hypothetical protein